MMNMRKGFCLVEMLVVIAILPIAAIVLDRLFHTLIIDFPRATAVVQENKIVLDMLRQMREDIDKATGLPGSFAGYSESDKLLLIECPNGIICYQLKFAESLAGDGQVLRRRLTDTQGGDSEETRTWSVTNAEIQWRVWRNNGKGYAVEVNTHVNQKLRAKLQKKMANSHLFFVGLFKEL